MSFSHELSQFARFINYAASHQRTLYPGRLRKFVVTIREGDRHWDLVDMIFGFIQSEINRGEEWTTLTLKEVRP